MPTSRPTTPAAISDTSSDPGSLSDLDSGWTDLESGGRHSPSTTSDAGDSEDARSAIDRYEGVPWEGITSEGDAVSEHGVDDDTFHSESRPAADPSHSLSFQQGISELTLEDWVADAVGSSLLSDDDSLDASTPHVSFHGSRSALRLAFPDPLSNAEDNLLPSHTLSRKKSQSTEGGSELGDGGSDNTRTLSSVTTPSQNGTTSADSSFSLPDEEEGEPEKSEVDYDIPSVELAPPSVAYALSIVLLGHPPLPHLKSVTMSTLIDMVASSLDGSPRFLEGSDSTRIYEVPIYTRQEETHAESEGTCTHRILISDRTSGSSLSSSFNAFDCPTLALVFIQPPLSSPFLPSLPFATRYLPLLLPSVSDSFASSLLDLSPSVLFDHSVPNISTPDNESRKSFALQQCEEIDILHNRLGETGEVLTVDEFVGLPPDAMSGALRDVLFPSKVESKEAFEKVSVGAIDGPGGLAVFRKPVVFISAFLVALLFSATVFLRGKPLFTPPSPQETAWSFRLHRTPPATPSSSTPSPASPELPRSHALSPASLKSFAVSVFRPEITADKVAGPSTDSRTRSDEGKIKATWTSPTQVTEGHRQIRLASIDPAARPLTLDAPSTKSVSLVPPVRQPSLWKGKAKETITDAPSDPRTPLPSSSTSVSTRISNALSPLFDAISKDLQELEEAIEALLRTLMQLKGQASQGISELAHVLSKRTEQGMQGFAGKVHHAAQSVGERMSKRNARARDNARKVRDAGERYMSVARQKFERGVQRARGNAKDVLTEGLAMGRRESRKLRRQAREQRKTAKKEAREKRRESKQMRGTELIFHSVMALVA